ncbi:MAG: class I SAM-dependent methyltransferase [Patescibacteria group bacterium]|nr:class I SAM-dependent methyltransferase [Patescibacteria group bacterium]
MKILTPRDLPDYELLDAGNHRRLERFGEYILDRPDPKVLWSPALPPAEWNRADAVYRRSPKGGGFWKFNRQLPKSWTMRWRSLTVKVQPTGFKHVGVFPEHEAVWDWISGMVQRRRERGGPEPHILNLFAYTGVASLAASAAGARVAHVDSSQDIVTWARENALLSGLQDRPIRWLIEDATRYTRREIRRGIRYDGIIIDAPKFGRGAKGEVWKIEEDLSHLLEMTCRLLTPDPLFVLLFSYTTEYSSLALDNMLRQHMRRFRGYTEFGELALTQKSNGFPLSTTVFARWRAV